jgi:2-aminobenzoate-CoA ligase
MRQWSCRISASSRRDCVLMGAAADRLDATARANGWNLTGDAFSQDEEGYFHFVARNDDMIILAGYNIAGPEVEAVLLAHEANAVIGLPDEERGQIVAAFVVLQPDVLPDEATAIRLQDHVKANIAPYKYSRTVRFLEALPKTQTVKIQRFQLKFLQ